MFNTDTKALEKIAYKRGQQLAYAGLDLDEQKLHESTHEFHEQAHVYKEHYRRGYEVVVSKLSKKERVMRLASRAGYSVANKGDEINEHKLHKRAQVHGEYADDYIAAYREGFNIKRVRMLSFQCLE